MKMPRLALIPLFLCFALTAQAWVSAEHVHIDHAAEVECQVCGGLLDLAPAVQAPVLVAVEQFSSTALLPHQVAKTRPVHRCSRAPPV
ncbi:MAG: hypothetical protein ACE37D_01625 [Pseudomonadales bacterium]